MPTFAASKAGYRALWNRCTILPAKAAEANATAAKIIANKARYQQVEAATGVPWFMVGALHDREARLNFNTYLGNGQPLNEETTQVPAGRGPFSSWLEGALDALKLQGFTAITFDGIERVLYSAEVFNGTGYIAKNENDPYVWAATNLQQAGKYVSDGSYSPSTWDTQLGVAAIIKAIAATDASVAAFCAGAPIVAAPTTTKGPTMTEATTTTTTIAAPAAGPTLGSIAAEAEKVVEAAAKVEPMVATITGMFVPGAAPVLVWVQPMVVTMIPYVERALNDIAAGNGGDFFTAFIEAAQHLTQGQPNSPTLSATK